MEPQKPKSRLKATPSLSYDPAAQPELHREILAATEALQDKPELRLQTISALMDYYAKQAPK